MAATRLAYVGMRQIKKILIQIKAEIDATIGETTASPPNAQATPLPPLKRLLPDLKTGKQCPSVQQKVHKQVRLMFDVNKRGAAVERTHFPASNIKVKAP